MSRLVVFNRTPSYCCDKVEITLFSRNTNMSKVTLAENGVAAFLMRLMIDCFDKTPLSVSCAPSLLYKPVAGFNPAQNCCRSKRQISSAAHLNITDGNILLHPLCCIFRWEHPMAEEWLPFKLRAMQLLLEFERHKTFWWTPEKKSW